MPKPSLYIDSETFANTAEEDVWLINAIFSSWITNRYKCLEDYNEYYIPSEFRYQIHDYLRRFTRITDMWYYHCPQPLLINGRESNITPAHTVKGLFVPNTGKILPVWRLKQLKDQGICIIHRPSKYRVFAYYTYDYFKTLNNQIDYTTPKLNISNEVEPYSLRIGQALNINQLIYSYSVNN